MSVLLLLVYGVPMRNYTASLRASSSQAASKFGTNSAGTGIMVDGAGHLYVTGTGTGAVVAKLSEATLGKIWSRNCVATKPAEALAVAVDTSGDPYVTGAFGGKTNFGLGALTTAGSTDVFAAKLNPATGLATWSDAGGGEGPDVAKGIAFDLPTGHVYIVGDYTPAAKFGMFTLGAQGAKNIFLASLT
jgi:hypothetical protein